jgi:sortase (surface protein transpeptidase)
MISRLLASSLAALLLAGCAGPAEPPTGADRVPRTDPPRTAASPTATKAREPTREPPSVNRVALPVRVSIPAIGVRADVVAVGLNPDGSMETPAYDSKQAGWYDRGPKPGEVGPAVIAAHVDSKTGRDVFYDLREMRPGDRIVVTDRAGARHTFTAQRLAHSDKHALPYREIWGPTKVPALRLVTCAGPYDRAAGEYEENLIVYATTSGG